MAQVLGIDAVRTKDVRVTHRAVLAHIAKARSIKNLENSTLVFCFESNLAFESQHLIHAVQEAGIKKWMALTEGAGGTLGWLTTNERKEVSSRLACASTGPRLGMTPFPNVFRSPCASNFETRWRWDPSTLATSSFASAKEFAR